MTPLPEASPQPTIVFDTIDVLIETEDEVVNAGEPVPVITVNVDKAEDVPIPVDELLVAELVSVIVVLEMTMIE